VDPGSCLASVSAEIRSGRIPHGRCGELITYAQTLPGLISAEVGDARASSLGSTLHSAYNVEQLAIMLREAPEKEPYLSQLEEASGKFQALAKLILVAP
jgi:hypothetical protein